MSYYDVKFTMIPFGWSGTPTKVRADIDTEDFVPVQVKQLTFDEWEKLHHDICGDSDADTSCFCEIEDNGRHGDGIRFRICAATSKNVIVETGIPDDALDTLIEALTAIRRLRDAEESNED
jgi:hypothetical protein